MAFDLEVAIDLAEKIEVIINNAEINFALRQNDAVRCRLRDAGRKLSLAMEARNDSIHRIAYSVISSTLPSGRWVTGDLANAVSPCSHRG